MTIVTPKAPETEEAFLGSCLMDKYAIETGLEVGLTRDDFYEADHGTIWQAMVDLYDDKQAVDVVTVAQALDGKIESPGLTVSSLSKAGASFFHSGSYAIIIRDKAVRRNLIAAAARITELARREDTDIESMLDAADNALHRTRVKGGFGQKRSDPADIIERMEGVRITGIKTRLPALNAISTGMVRSHLWVVGGFSSTGKSAVLCNLVEDAVNAGAGVMVASTEMSQEQYMLRLISLTSNVPQRLIRHGGMNMEQGMDYKMARDFWKTAKIRVHDDLYNFARISRKAKQVKEEIGLDVLFVDFIQNINETGDEVKDARVTAINLQALAKELDVCVVALSQISNAMALQQSQEGVSSNYYQFRGSGSIKDAADLAIMLTRDRENLPDVLWLKVVKNRHDSLTDIPCKFELETGRIRQMTEDEWQSVNPNAGRKSRRGIANAVTAVT